MPVSFGASEAMRTGSTSRASVRVGGIERQTVRGAVLHIPEPLIGGVKAEDAPLSTVPTSDALAKWLLARGVDTQHWGEGDTKDVSKFWKEMDLDEAGLELWRRADGVMQPVRVVHVLRAKVCSPESYQRGIFLFNTWQQYGDGRQRTRNGLLSEKLCMSEMPLEDHLADVCARAVTEEEMQRVCESALKIGPGTAAPEYDPTIKCPLKVIDQKFVDHTIELETSKSYPGLLTMYHLYTVDIICSGLPAVDFNTLEFAHEDKEGNRPLKYIHAWVWLEWAQIQRYLLEGSTIKERKKKDSFPNAIELLDWLSQFDIELGCWGNGQYSSVDDLFDELQNEATHLELWGRQDGVPLLMRVVHAVQLKVDSTDPRQAGKFLFNTWRQNKKGDFKTVNRLMSKKVSTATLPFDEDRFAHFAKEAVAEELTYIVDAHFQLDPKATLNAKDLKKSGVNVTWVAFEDHRVTVEESVSYKSINTMYHLYSMEVECENIPLADFGSLEFRPNSKTGQQEIKFAHGWRWFYWEQILDVLQLRTKELDRSKEGTKLWVRQQSLLEDGLRQLENMGEVLSSVTSKLPSSDKDLVDETTRLQDLVMADVRELQAHAERSQRRCASAESTNLAKILPPSMLSKMSEQKIVSKDFFEETEHKRLMEEKANRAMRGSGVGGGRKSTSSMSSSSSVAPLLAWSSDCKQVTQ